MSKELEQLRREYAENEAKLQQYRHRVQRLEQRKKYYEKGERQKRAHRLITRGAAVESVAPEVKPLSAQRRTVCRRVRRLPRRGASLQ